MKKMMDEEKPSKGPKIVPVKNKLAAPVQITAEQLLREAKEKQLEYVAPPPRQKIADADELDEVKLRKRKEFEDAVRKNRQVIARWIRYANWEESQNEFARARSVWERALDVDHRSISLWLKYAAMEMRNKQINHARNVLDRAVTILPRANQLWYKYVFMEEVLGNIPGTRAVFERWLEWEPEEQVWNTYINFEMRYNEHDRAQNVFERLVIVHPEHRNWGRFARFEERNKRIVSARRVYEQAVEFFGDDHINEKLLLAFAAFEERQKEYDRALAIYQYGLDRLGSNERSRMFSAYTAFERKYGNKSSTERIVNSKRRFQYEKELEKNPGDYDTWFDYIKLLESDETCSKEQIREAYELAVSRIPSLQQKREWRRYIYFWIKYALFEELICCDIDRTRQVYKTCLSLITHKKFTFAKIWVMFAHFELRQMNLQEARKIMGTAIGMCPKDKLFRSYIDMEISLREFDRCRKLYEKFIQFSPENSSTWVKFAELENLLGETDRARFIYDFAVTGDYGHVDMPELLWKAYIDFELSHKQIDRARRLYERLLQLTQNVKVWTSFALFEANVSKEDGVLKARSVFERAYDALKGNADDREALVERWIEFEMNECGNNKSLVDKVRTLAPRRVLSRRKIMNESGEEELEEYVQLIFPDEEVTDPSMKLLSAAKAWKRKQQLETVIEE